MNRGYNPLTLAFILAVVSLAVICHGAQHDDMGAHGDVDCHSDPERGECRDFGDNPRWFYNDTSKGCEQFWYGGCGGNDNNYENQEECESSCKHADRGTDNIVITEDDAKVKDNERKPAAALSKCLLSSDRGRYCGKWDVKWFYNSTSLICERFWYGGCDGNDNRFDEEDSCVHNCISTEDVCKMSVVMGNCRARLPRWYYDSARRECRYFEYSGCGGNGNQFSDRENCERQCLSGREALERTGCRTSRYGCCPDQLTSAQGNNNEGCPNACKGTQYGCCDDDITPAQGPDQEGCEVIEISSGDGVPCGETEFGCCKDGETAATGPNSEGCGVVTVAVDKTDGDITVDVPALCKQSSDLGTCRDNMVVMWFYNVSSSRCEMFWYGGCNGNQNRFKSEKECLTLCRQVVKEPDNRDREVEAVSVCDQQKEIGPCRGAIQRYFYNKVSRQCEEFEYGGCLGNQNNFEERETCERYCGRGTPIAKAGECPNIYVDEENCASTCNYDGDCRGNEKCCSSQSGCRKCYAPAEKEITLTPEEVCSLDKETGPCRAAFTRYYYNRETRDCESFVYGGCRGNKNNFDSKDLCRRYCRARIDTPSRPTRQNICELRPALGPCDRNLTKYYYNIETLRCETFTYGGCLGNHNNFVTEAKCSSYCNLRTRDYSREELCKQDFEEGSCRGSITRYYYDARQGRCFDFSYGGCQGNGNNFGDEESCMSACRGVRTTLTDRVDPQPRPRPNPAPTVKPPTNNRAEGTEEDVCSLSLQSPCTTSQSGPFWYYDTRSGVCREVPNGECNNNRNNFRSRAQCERYCNRERVCQPLFYTSEIRCLALIPAWTFNRNTGKCEEFNYGGCGGSANNFASEVACRRRCEERVIIEAVTDAPEVVSPAEVCAMPEDSGNCLASIRHWRYDAGAGQCVQFEYGGCGGNNNNFETRALCESYCSRRVVCQTYEEPEIGCFASIRRWRFDPSSNLCESFTYGGCGGSANNFGTFESCEGKCVEAKEDNRDREANTNDNRVSTWRDICQMRYNTGPCRQRVQKWYYNSQARKCETFIYGGCLGNHNNFESEDQCMTYCGNVFGVYVPPTEEPEPEIVGSGDISTDPTGVAVCHLSSEVGVCRALISVWYYNSQQGECQRFNYGGCGGNGNRFGTQEECEQQCNARDICLLQRDSGTGFNYSTRYHFDYSAQTCRSFGFGGEDGNANNFESSELCLRRCDSLIRRPQVDSEKPGTCPALYFPASSARCHRQCVEDGNCAGQKKCCPLGCNRICLDPEKSFRRPKPGECPANPRRNDGLLGACAPQCREDSQCSGNQKCCYYGCGYQCIDPVSEQAGPNAGYCPAKTDKQGLLGACAPQCQDDGDCGRTKKCCMHGCGLQCVNPVAEEPYQMDSPMRGEATSTSHNSAMLHWQDPSLGRDQRIRDNRFYTIRYFSYDHGLYNYKNATDLSLVVNGLTPDTEYTFNVRSNKPPYLSEWSTEETFRTSTRAVVNKLGSCPAVGADSLGTCVNMCDGDSDCSGAQKCCSNGCGHTCVNPQGYDVCTLSKDRGDCSDWTVRWYYKIDENGDGVCDRFWFGGCEEQGNGNRFLNESDCQAACGIQVVTEPPRTARPYDCRRSRFGCCADQYTPAVDEAKSNCPGPSGPKPGECPANPRRNDGLLGACAPQCREDSQCSGNQKCCYYGCGYQCIDPVSEVVRPESDIVPAVPGESVTLRCSRATNGTWYRDGKLVESNDRREVNRDTSLTIFAATIDDDGVYACHVYYGSSRPIIYRYTVQVRIPIGILDGPDTIMVKPNHMAFLHCEAYGNPKPTVSWQKNGQALRTGSRYETFSNGTLLIRRASEDDMDRYMCTADNQVSPTVSRTIDLKLREMLVARIENDNGRVTEGGRITLSCEGRGYPEPTITWEKMGQPIRTGGNVFISSEGRLVVRDANLSDTGTYTCIVANSIEKIETSTTVQVIHRLLPDENDKCVDKTSLMKCRLIVTARLCGYTMYSKICCNSCKSYFNGRN